MTARTRNALMIGALLAAVLAGAQATAAEGAADKIVFKPAADTGLTAIMQKWRADELKRKGGKFKVSHEWWPYKIDVLDYDNDGAPDILVAHHGSAGCKLLRNTIKETGKLAFVDVTGRLGVHAWDLPMADEAVKVWDFDGDGYLDIAGFSDENLTPVFFNLAARKLVAIPKFTFNPLAGTRAIADLNGDGYLDVSGLSFSEASHKATTFQFLYAPERRTFTKRQLGYVPPSIPADVMDFMDKASKKHPNSRAWFNLRYKTDCDLNGDGIKDVVFMGYKSYRKDTTTCYLLADKDGRLTDRTGELGLPHDGTPAAFGDLNADGNLDIIVSCGPRAGVYLGNGKGHYSLVREGRLRKFLTQNNGHVHRISLADYNNDGRMDLVVGLARWPVQQVYQNMGGGVFELVERTDKTWTWTPGYDMNGDGLPDIVVGGPGRTDVTVYVNQTKTSNHYCDLYPRMPKPNPFGVGASLEVFHAGAMGKAGARPFLVDQAHADGRPIHVGLGAEKTFDVRATFPGKEPKVVELKGVQAAAKIEVWSNGASKEIK